MTNKKLAIIGASVFAALVIAAIVLFGVQNSKRNEEIRQQTEQLQKQAEEEKAAREAEKAAHEAELEEEKATREAEQKRLQGIENAIKGTPRPDPELCMRISWGSSEKEWENMPVSKEEVYELSRQSSYGDPVYFNGKVTGVYGSLVIYRLYSPAETQTIVWLKYKPDEDDDEVSAMVLLQGEYGCEDITDLPGGLNYQKKCCSRCILYGGKFYHTPESVGVIHEKCTPKRANKGCTDCGDVGAGDGQGDGYATEKETDSYSPKIRKGGGNW